MEKQIDDTIQKYEITKLIFAVLGASFLVGATITIPVLPMALGTILKAVRSFKSASINDKKIKRSLIRLKERDIVSFENKGDEIYVRVKEKWHGKVIQYSIAQLLNFKREANWNGEWFAVFFDVPEIQRNKRDKLRYLLKILGFYQYQQSVYVFPYSCFDEVVLIKQIVEGGAYLKYAVIKQIEGENDLKIHFGLS